ncbi:unnamed protein product [Adineta ricciae]|uniref:F-box domain-containing protein n=1 Tax=Adineta ricciae TaxID=249248 RepID=A0A814PXQ4_ADIRI|nr:unnamed protein product [Adineta ricciae]CAF1287723.1 unnamed protein product [Adineta ricciae]
MTTLKENKVGLLDLPTELLYRICDFLDTKTIVRSIRHVCTQLFAVTESYNRYKIHVNSIAMKNICRIIPLENVLLLEIDDNNSVIIDIHRFQRLETLVLHRVDINEVKLILRHVIKNCNLITFSLDVNPLENVDDLLNLVSMILLQSSLRQCILNFNLNNVERFLWPFSCRATNHSPNLHALIMNNCWKVEINESFLTKSYTQLHSLTLNDLKITMDKLEYCLSLLSSLTHLDLTSSGKPFEFIHRLSQWEYFLRLKLPRLAHLEFCIFCYCCDWNHFDRMITAFRNPFWLEEKRWFVTCQFRDDWTSSFTVFTSSKPSTHRSPDNHHFDRIVCSNSIASEQQ